MPCLDCGAPGSRLCPGCASGRNRARGSSSARGYGYTHRTTRARLLPDAAGTLCPLCNEEITEADVEAASTELDLHHSTALKVDRTSLGDVMAHASCNRGAPASEG